jgi:hypothetical protein
VTKAVSCACQLNGTMASITPVSPPSTKVKKNPMTYSMGRRKLTLPSHSVPIQAKTWIAVGTATSADAALKKASAMCGMPTVNMWWTHRPKDRNTSPAIAATIAPYPRIVVRDMIGMIVDSAPAAGRKMI